MSKHKYELSSEFIAKLKSIVAKRARTVIDHILEHGFITTEELKDTYGYNHPPRAIRDVREKGIPIETYRVTGSDGRQIAAYRFGDPTAVRGGTHEGRKAWPKAFKETLVSLQGAKCGICSTAYDARYLQIDHRVPYEVGGDQAGSLDPSDFMLVCASCNRAKSWSCEQCTNWTTEHKLDVCHNCYWANPTNYSHIALREIRRVDVVWSEEEVAEHDQLLRRAEADGVSLPDFIKNQLRK